MVGPDVQEDARPPVFEEMADDRFLVPLGIVLRRIAVELRPQPGGGRGLGTAFRPSRREEASSRQPDGDPQDHEKDMDSFHRRPFSQKTAGLAIITAGESRG
jgi:hypothetical protein